MGSIPGSGRSLEKEMATHSSILASRIPWTEDPGGLLSMGSQRVRHDLVIEPRCDSGKESSCQFKRPERLEFNPWVRKIPWRRKWQPTPVFLPGECHGQRSLAGYSPWGHKSWTRLSANIPHSHIQTPVTISMSNSGCVHMHAHTHTHTHTI